MESRIAARAYLASIATEARQGSLRLLCPFCDGGPDRELSLVLTIRDDGTFYCCHRASCGEKGAIGANTRRLLGGSESKIVKQHEPYRGAQLVMHASYPAYRRFRGRAWGPTVTDPVNIGLYTDGDYTKEVWILRNILGERVGVQVRWTEGEKKRVKTYKETEGDVYTSYNCLQDYFEVGESGYLAPVKLPTWIVEDPMSAAVLSSWNHPAVALCGTYLSPSLAVELSKQEEYTSGFMVALDPGAEDAARRVCYTLAGTTLLPVQVRFLACDIKDMTRDQLKDILENKRSN